MANWLILHLHGGAFADRQLLSTATVKELHSPQNLQVGGDKFPFEGTGETYALGWRRSLFDGRVHLAHSGGIIGFPAYAAFLPAEKIGVVVLANGPKPVRDEYSLHKAIAFEAFQRLLGGDRDWRVAFLARNRAVTASLSRIESETRAQRPAAPAIPTSGLVGCYVSDEAPADRLEVRRMKSGLGLRFLGPGAFAADLEPWESDRFRLLAEPNVADVLGPLFVTFARGRPDRADSLSLFNVTFSRGGEGASCLSRAGG